MLVHESWLVDSRAMETLQTFAQHRSVTLVPKTSGDVNCTPRVDPEQVAVVGKVMNGA